MPQPPRNSPVAARRAPTRLAPVRPDYDGAWVGGIVPGLLGGGPPAWFPEPVRDARAVVLLVLDGLGWEMLRARTDLMPRLAGMQGGAITTAVPSTTATALTSIATGAAPAVHGILGYRVRVGGRALNVLRWQVGGDEAVPDPAEVQPVPPFLGRAVPVVTRAEFRTTGFTTAHLRDTTFTGWKTVSGLVVHVLRAIDGGAPFVYAYYEGIDKVAHEFGLCNEFQRAELAFADRLVGDLLDRLPPEVALLVTADHGQVNIPDPPAAAVDLGEVRRLVASYSGEGRFRGLHARSGASAELVAACRSRYEDRAWVLPREALFDEGWLGAGGGLAVRSRVGDVVLAAREPVVFVDPGQAKEARMRSQHGSLTPAEMLVPLLAARGG